jgi:selenocysteine lyase/cysteine desulfurase
MPTALEAGTLNGHGLAGLHAALSYLEQVGIDRIREKEQQLMWRFYEGIRNIDGITVYGDFETKERCPIVTWNLFDYDAGMVSDELFQEYGIASRPGAHCAPLMHVALGTVEQGAVRFSFSHFNTEEEIDTAIAALKEM